LTAIILAKSLDELVSDMSITAVVINQNGLIDRVSAGWKITADRLGLVINNYGIGENYFKHCVFDDPKSFEIIRGIRGVLCFTSQCYGTIYPCGVIARPAWFILGAFPISLEPISAIILHIDVSRFLQNDFTPATVLSFGDMGHAITERFSQIIHRSVEHAFAAQGSNVQLQGASRAGARMVRLLNDNQLRILALLGTGATNLEIATACSMSINAAKSQSSLIIRKLGLSNRAQAAVFAVRHGVTLDEK
jgi:DNA-binding CsgD family transcriptional regulator